MSGWTCSSCTLLNSAVAARCDVCGAASPASTQAAAAGLACPACSLLNSLSSGCCEICSTRLVVASAARPAGTADSAAVSASAASIRAVDGDEWLGGGSGDAGQCLHKNRRTDNLMLSGIMFLRTLLRKSAFPIELWAAA